MVRSYSDLPNTPTIPVKAFKIDVPQADLDDLAQLVRLTRLPKSTYENVQTDGSYGVNRQWLVDCKEAWLNFDWRKQETRINEIPAYLSSIINQDGRSYDVHFAALFSRKADAVPILFSHGWPGAFLEFLPMMEHIKSKWSQDELP